MGGAAGSCCWWGTSRADRREAQDVQTSQLDGAILALGMCRVRSSPATRRTGAKAEPGGARPAGQRPKLLISNKSEILARHVHSLAVDWRNPTRRRSGEAQGRPYFGLVDGTELFRS